MLLHGKFPLYLYVLYLLIARCMSDNLVGRDQDTIPSGNNWVYPTKILVPPGCTKAQTASEGCPKPLDLASCTSLQCTRTIFGGCALRENLTDTACLCQKYNSQSCKPCSQGGVVKQAWFRWLNATCSSIAGWSGLPGDWTSQTTTAPDVLPVGTINSAVYSKSPATYTFNISFPACANNSCSPFTSCLVNGTDIAWTGASPSSGQSYGSSTGGQSSAGSTSGSSSYRVDLVYLDRTCMCSQPLAEVPGPCTGCTSPIDRTRLLTWFNATCHNATGFNNAASDWARDLLVIDKNYLVQSELKWPDCVGGSACTPSLNDTETSCTSTRCKLDKDGNCAETTLAVERACFCKDLSYGKSCNGTCGLVWQRQEHLNWLNATCSPVTGWWGLPNNWTSQLAVRDDELLPWHWEVQTPGYLANATNITASANGTNGTADAASRPECPSTAAKVGVYAAVNVAVAVLVPILGRRTVIHRLTGGYLGNPWSRSWLVTGPLSIGLQLGSNVLNAHLVTQVPGFAQVPVGDLTLLWCTRPRLAWLVVALLPVQAAEAMYFSVAASCVAAELVLQLVGSYYLGYATNYARAQRFYTAGALDSSPHRTNAHIMYAGSLLWLVVIGFALFAAAWSVLRVNDHISSLSRRLRGAVRLSKKRHKAMLKALSAALEAEEEQNSQWANLTADFHRLGNPAAAANARAAVQRLREVRQRQLRRLQELAEEWQFLHVHLTADDHALKKARKRARKLKVDLAPEDEADADRAEFTAAGPPDGAPHGEAKDSAGYVARMRAARAELARLERLHREIPAARLDTAERNARQLRVELAAVRGGAPRVPLAALRRLAAVSVAVPATPPQRVAAALVRQIEADGAAVTRGEEAGLAELNALAAQWQRVVRERAGEETPADMRLRQLKEISRTAIVGMFGCWVAQWIWWIGYIGVAGDT